MGTDHGGRLFCTVTNSVAGTAFLFGSGIYCGTFLLGTNFIYRLIFLLLCVRQLLDWQKAEPDHTERKIGRGLFRYRSIRAVVEWKFQWTHDFLVGAAASRLATVLWSSSDTYVQLSEQRHLATDLTVGHIATILIRSRAGVASRIDSNHGAIRY